MSALDGHPPVVKLRSEACVVMLEQLSEVSQAPGSGGGGETLLVTAHYTLPVTKQTPISEN